MRHARYAGGVIRQRGDRWQAEWNREGTRERQTFDTEAGARAHLELRQTAHTRDERPLDGAALRDYNRARALLPSGVTLVDAVTAYVATHAGVAAKPLADVVAAYLADAEARGLRPRSLYAVKSHLGRLRDALGTRQPDAIQGADLSRWLDAHTHTPLTRDGYRRAWRAMWRWAILRRLASRDPTAELSAPLTDDSTPGILTPAQLAALLRAAQNGAPKADPPIPAHPELVPYIAVQAFGGLRTSEAYALEWAEVTPDGIRVRPEVAKARRSRIVPLTPTLSAWLAGRRGSGRLCPCAGSARDRRLADLRKAAGISEWPHNALRHSFASYWYAAHPKYGAPALAAILGHSDADVLHRHYRAVVSERDARAYFAIRPAPLDRGATIPAPPAPSPRPARRASPRAS